jgi:N-acetylmuramic acid 6-phosphate etherase
VRRAVSSKPSTWILGIEGGGSRSVALAVSNSGSVSRREAGPANLRLLSDAALAGRFRELARGLPAPQAIGIGMAGARSVSDFDRIRRAAARVWPGVPCHASGDLETALLAAEDRPAARLPPTAAQVLVLSGTGSCCYGRTNDGRRTAKVGGWGQLLGDKGSGYEIGLRALKAVVYYFDRDGRWPVLGRRLLRALLLNEPDDLIGWAKAADKSDIAALAVEVFAAWNQGDRIAADILEGAAHSLAKDGAACARRLVKPGARVQFVLHGGVLQHQPRFTARVARELKRLWPYATITRLRRESAWGGVELARQLADRTSAAAQTVRQENAPEASPPVESARLSPTEERNPRSMGLDRMPLSRAVELMLREDARVPRAVLAERRAIERGVRLIVRSFRRGGRLFYVGAGTSGRLGVLDASECPPTFRAEPDMVQGIIAGGERALRTAVEGAEDDADAGARAAAFRGVGPRDTLVGIAASGRTPFVWGALGEARRRGAATMLISFNPHLRVRRDARPDVVITPRIGPELLTGSTRLKAGTATKLILNIFTTLAMVRMGKVLSNLMIDVRASNEKLRDRATRITCLLTEAGYAESRHALERTNWRIKAACARLKRRKQWGNGSEPRSSRRAPAAGKKQKAALASR